MTVRLAAASDGWRGFCAAPERLDPRLQASLDAGRVILLTSRFSTPTGENARTSAINSLFETVRGLERQSGIDVAGALPSREDLDLRLRNAPLTRTKRLQSGKDIIHRFVEIDLRPAAPVAILMATGTGRIAAAGFIQPFTQRVAELVWEMNPAILATKRWDRTTRNDDLVGPLLMGLTEHRTWVCTDKLFREMNEDARLLLMVESFAARSNTSGEDHAKRLGQADRTGREFVDGQVAYHLPSPLPAGFGVATMKRRPGLDVEKVAYLDMPGCRPDPERVADGLSDVRNAAGEVVDQVDNVRFFLAHYGVPAWMDGQRLFREMARRRLSTSHTRNMYGADAHITTTRGHGTLVTILDSLDVYETGVLRRAAGGKVAPVEITGVMPPDGPWATAEDFARIRAFRAKGKARAGKKVKLPLAGIRATYNGVNCRTRSIGAPSTVHHDDPCLGFKRVRDDRQEVRVEQHVQLPWAVFAESIADAVITAGSGALGRLEADANVATVTAGSEVDAKLTDLDGELVMLQQQRDGFLSQLGQLGADGKPVLHGAFLAAAQDQFQALEAKSTELERRREGLIAQQQVDRGPSREDADPADLPRLLASLRDPSDDTYAQMWRRIISPLVFTTTPIGPTARASRRLLWRGAIRIDDGSDGTVVIPFEGSYDYHRLKPGSLRTRRRRLERQHEFIAALRAGTPYDAIDLPARYANRPRVARLLGIDDDHPLFECDDPRILATATALLLRGQDDAIPEPDEDKGFLDAICRVHLHAGAVRPWRRTRGEIPTAFYDLAADDGIVTADEIVARCATTRATVHTAFGKLREGDGNWISHRKKGYHLQPCPRCDSHDRRPAQIPEVTGLLCRNCEHDEASIHWPLEVYNPYLA